MSDEYTAIAAEGTNSTEGPTFDRFRLTPEERDEVSDANAREALADLVDYMLAGPNGAKNTPENFADMSDAEVANYGLVAISLAGAMETFTDRLEDEIGRRRPDIKAKAEKAVRDQVMPPEVKALFDQLGIR